jgi:hypothetical protein
VCILLGVYALLILSLNTAFIQGQMGLVVSKQLSQLLNSEVKVGKVELQLLNRIVISDVQLKDQEGKEMLQVARLSSKFDLIPLLTQQKVVINNVQLSSFKARLHKKTLQDKPNYQFLIDAFASSNQKKQSSSIDLRINSIILRRGNLSYDVLSKPETPGIWNTKHLKVDSIYGKFALKALTPDSINAHIKQIRFHEQSGLMLNSLSLKLVANHKKADLSNVKMRLPNSQFKLSKVSINTPSLLALDFEHSLSSVKGKVENSYVQLGDLSCFNEALKDSKKQIKMNMSFKAQQQKITLSPIQLLSPGYFNYEGIFIVKKAEELKDTQIEARISQGVITQTGLQKIDEIIHVYDKKLPSALLDLGNIYITGTTHGSLKDIKTQLKITSKEGEIELKTKASLTDSQTKAIGSILCKNINLGKIYKKPQLFGHATGKIDFELKKTHKLHLKIDANLSHFQLKGYNYRKVRLSASYNTTDAQGRLYIYDPNLILTSDITLNELKNIPKITLNANCLDFNPHALHLTKHNKGAKISALIGLNFKHFDLEKVIGQLKVNSLVYTSPQKKYNLNEFKLISLKKENNEKEITIHSDFLDAHLKGNYSKFRTLYDDLVKNVAPHISALIKHKSKREITKQQHISLKAKLKNLELFEKVFNIPVQLQQPIDIKAQMNPNDNHLSITAHIPKIKYEKDTYCNGLLRCNNKNKQISGLLRITKIDDKDRIRNMTVSAEVINNLLKTQFSWANADNDISNFGKIKAKARFIDNSRFLKAKINIEPTHIVLNDSSWQLAPTEVEIDSGYVDVKQFIFKHKKQHIIASGRIGKSKKDTLHAELNGIGLGYIFNLIRVNVRFNGDVTGKAYIAHALEKPKLLGNMNVKNFSFNDSIVGDLGIELTWDHIKNGLHLDGIIRNNNAKTDCKGYVFIKDKKLDLNFKAENTNVSFLAREIRGTVQNFSGKATGNARLYGGFKSLNLVGKLFTKSRFDIDMVNIPMHITDTLNFRTNGVFFQQNRVHDNYGNTGTLSGAIRYKHFKNSRFDLLLNTNGMLIYNIPQKSSSIVYGNIFASGETKIKGQGNNIAIEAKLTPDKKSHFAYVTSPTESAINNQFITFVDKTRYWKKESTTTHHKKEKEVKDDSKDLHLTLMATVDPNLAVDVVMDPSTGDYIRMRGNGAFRVQFYNKGKFMMNGDFLINRGDYHFSMQQIIRKTFSLKSGSSIHFEEDAQNAQLDLKTFYTVNSASLSDLGITNDFSQNNIKVNCLMNITGTLKTPNFNFDIEIPNVSEEERELVRSSISTEEEMNMQIIHLLGVGKFYAQNYTNNGQQSSNTMTSVLSSTLSGQLNSFLSQVVNSSKWNFGTNLSTGEKGWTDVEVEGLFSGQLLNNRLLINGNFGYKDNPMSKTNFVGDFSAELLLTQSGELRLKAYNQTNDRYFGKNTLTTQGLGIMFKKDFFNWRDFFQLSGKKSRK